MARLGYHSLFFFYGSEGLLVKDLNLANFRIMTNNPLVQRKYSQVTTLVDGSVQEVFVAGRNAIHQGAKLINHPVCGSVKPNESPYKTLLLSKTEGEPLDFYSLRLIEGAFQVLRKLPVKHIPYTEKMLEDYQVIDSDLVDSAIVALPPAYHF